MEAKCDYNGEVMGIFSKDNKFSKYFIVKILVHSGQIE